MKWVGKGVQYLLTDRQIDTLPLNYKLSHEGNPSPGTSLVLDPLLPRSPLYLPLKPLARFLSMSFAARKPIVFFVFPDHHSQHDRKRQTACLGDP